MDLNEVAKYVTDNFFRRKIHRVTSDGTAHRFLPVVLDATGKLDRSLYDDADIGDVLNDATAEAIVDADTMPFNDASDSSALKKITWANVKAAIKTYADGLYVALTGNQTVAGVKTFTSQPEVSVNASYAGVGITNAHTTSGARVTFTNNAGETGSVSVYSTGTGNGLASEMGIGGENGLVLGTDGNVASGGTNSIQFRVGGFNTAQERMRIDSAGEVYIYTGDLRIVNAKGVRIADTGGTYRQVLLLSSGNVVQIGNQTGPTTVEFYSGSTSPTMMMNSSTQVFVRAGGSTGNEAKLGGILYQSITTVGNVGGGNDDLMTYSIPASTLANDGDSIWFEAIFVLSTAANAKTMRMIFGATTLGDVGYGSGVGGNIYVRGRIYRVTATTQRVIMMATDDNLTVADTTYTTPGETLSGAVTLKGQGTGTSDNDVQQVAFTIGYDPVNT